MSMEEQDAVILRIVKERAEAKRERTLIASELKKAGDALYEAAGTLRHIDGNSIVHNPDYYEAALQKLQVVSSERTAQLLRQFLQLTDRIRQHNEAARQLGID